VTARHIDVSGREESPAVVLVHGAGANRGMWRPQVRTLAGEFRVIAPDLPGHGDHPERRFRFEPAVTDLQQVLARQVPGRAIVVGISLGGYVAMGAAAADPARIGALVLSGATAEYLGWDGFTTRASGVLTRVLGPVLRRASERSLRVAGNSEAAEAAIGIGLSIRGAAQALMSVPGRDYHALCAGFPGPVLILNGERDGVNRRCEVDAARRWDAELVVLEDCGHACAVTRPDAFAAAVAAFARKAAGGAG
jgi:pimeloyl-ACP methyl ester carboxylesterase